MPYSVWPSASTRAAPASTSVVKQPGAGTVALTGLAPTILSAGAFTDNFTSDNNPLPAPWRTIDTTYQTACKSLGGRAFGTQPSGGGRPPYQDSNGFLAGYGNDYQIEGTVWHGTFTGISEVEILLRGSQSSTVLHQQYGDTFLICYEINWSHNGAYLNLGRFKGALLQAGGTTSAPAIGDKFRASIVGQRIRAWINDVLLIDYTDNDASLKITTGDPGIGFYIDSGVGDEEFGFESVTVTAL